MRSRILYLIAQVAFVVGFLLLWEWASSTERIDPFFFGRPSDVWDRLQGWADDGTLVKEGGSTLRLLVIGYLVGLSSGVALGCLLGAWKPARDVLEPFMVFLNAVPRVILYPFLVVWMGFGTTPKVVTITAVMLSTVTLSVAAGFREVQGDHLANMRALGARPWHMAVHVYVPSLFLWLLTTCRITFGFAFQAAIASEVITSSSGLGRLIVLGQIEFDVNAMYAALAVVAVLALCVDQLLNAVERRATRWMPTRR